MDGSTATNGRDWIAVIGAGAAGLVATRVLHDADVPVRVFEASDEIGGRIRTDEHEGFLLDRGFQVFLTAYPEAKRWLDARTMDWRPFYSGALVRVGDRFHRMADPWHHPVAGAKSVLTPIMGWRDAVRMASLRSHCVKRTRSERVPQRPVTTKEFLRQRGFSIDVIERFFRPFFGGVFLESELGTSSSFFEFTFAMFALGRAAVPARGMQDIPRQLAAALPVGTVRLHAPVSTIDTSTNQIEFEDGSTESPHAIIVATDLEQTTRLLGESELCRESTWNSNVTLYFAADVAPVNEPILVLNANRDEGPVNHACVMSNASRHYAPGSQSLIALSVLGDGGGETEDELATRARLQMRVWFGSEVDSWRFLRAYRIPHSLPAFTPGIAADQSRGFVELSERLIACGDAFDTPSINGAMRSGRLAAEHLLSRLNARNGVGERAESVS